MTDALLMIDVQRNMFDPVPVHDAEAVLDRLGRLLSAARRHGIPVIHVRNNGGAGEVDEPRTPGWEIHPLLAPSPGEPVVDKWEPNAFASTGLAALATDAGADTVVLAGMQSEWCIAATGAGAEPAGLAPLLVSDAHSTYDGDSPAVDLIADVNRIAAEAGLTATTAEVLLRWDAATAADV